MRWTACGLGASIVEKCVWFTAVFYVAVQSGSALVHGIASVSVRLWTFFTWGDDFTERFPYSALCLVRSIHAHASVCSDPIHQTPTSSLNLYIEVPEHIERMSPSVCQWSSDIVPVTVSPSSTSSTLTKAIPRCFFQYARTCIPGCQRCRGRLNAPVRWLEGKIKR